ncbi:hypothetical protein ONZ45_g17292 [Pleurotus djamor]|nr:hypothetical protein ONZ45_g17292 [Pleurotus djamor]
MQCADIKLKQTNHHLDLLAKLKCDQGELRALESIYDELRQMQTRLLSTRPKGLNPWEGMRYLYQVCALKKAAKALYTRSEELSETTRKANRSKYCLKLNKNDVRNSPPQQQAGAHGPEPDNLCDEPADSSEIVYNEVRDSDDEDSDSEGEAPSTSLQNQAGPVILDESNMPTPRVNTFGPGISS